MRPQKVPVFMYHSIGVPHKDWIWNYLTCPWHIFEKHLLFFKAHNYCTINITELYEYIYQNKPIPNNSVVLTFDDGYSDNYVFAYPLLKKHGFKGTIFINPEFVDPRDTVREKFNGTNAAEVDHIGFLSWVEMKEMETFKVMDIQSHALTHTWYPISNEVVDFRHPNDSYHWMTWNEHFSLKPYLQIDNPELVEFGTPVYKYAKSLTHKRIHIDMDSSYLLNDYVKKNGNREFFKDENWKQILFSELKRHKPAIYTQENDREFRDRIRFELYESKRLIEENLNKKVDFLCWPGGSGSELGVEIAEEVGYKMTTAAKDLKSSVRKRITNSPKHKSARIGRISPVIRTIGLGHEQKTIFADNFILWLRIRSFKSPFLFKVIINAMIVFYGKFFYRLR